MRYLALFLEENDGQNLEDLKSAFRTWRFETVSTPTDEAALDQIRAYLPHVLVVELGPENAARRLEWVESLKSGPLAYLRIVLASRSPPAEVVEAAIRLGVDDFILLPSDSRTLSRKAFLLAKKLEARPFFRHTSLTSTGTAAELRVPGVVTGISETGLCAASPMVASRPLERIAFSTALFHEIGVRAPGLLLMNSGQEWARDTGYSVRTYFQLVGWGDSERRTLSKWLTVNQHELQSDRLPPGSYTRPPNVLIVEDNAEFVAALSEYIKLEYPGAKVFVCPDVKSGIACATERRVDVTILDLHFASGSGTDFLHAFPRSERRFPVLVLTADRTDETLELALHLGAEDYLMKPIDELVLKSKLESLLHRRYLSPFAFFGRDKGLAPIVMSCPVRLEEMSEDKVIFWGPAAFHRQAQIRLQLFDLDIAVEVEDASAETRSGTGRTRIVARIHPPSTLEDRAKLRHTLRLLECQPAVSPAITP